MAETVSIDGFGPLPVHRPTTPADVQALVRGAGTQAIYPVGGRTMLDLGLPPTRPGFALDTTGLATIIDYPARDMTITVQAGVTLADVAKALAAENQWLPIDVPFPERATVGGAIAANASGGRRFAQGTLRDYLLGVSFVSDEGELVSAGGRVVKNVAGYDLMKLHTGALGTLGVLTQVTLKVKPRPEASELVSVRVAAADLASALDKLHASASRPAAVELLNAPAAKWLGLDVPEWVLLVGFEEKAETVAWQLRTLRAEFAAEPCDAWPKLVALPARPESRFLAKLVAKPSELAAKLQSLPAGVAVHAHALNGIAWLHADAPFAPPSGTMTRRTPGPKTFASAFGDAPALKLMRHVKATLDPRNSFNPGRLF